MQLLQEELAAAGLHLWLEHPFVFALAVECSLLQPLELQCESWSQFLKVDTLGVLELVTIDKK